MTTGQRTTDPLQLAIEAGQLQNHGRLAEAVDLYRRALAIAPHMVDVQNNLGTALQALRRYDEARAAFGMAIQLRPDFPEAHNNLGNVDKALGDYEAALASYRRAAA